MAHELLRKTDDKHGGVGVTNRLLLIAIVLDSCTQYSDPKKERKKERKTVPGQYYCPHVYLLSFNQECWKLSNSHEVACTIKVSKYRTWYGDKAAQKSEMCNLNIFSEMSNHNVTVRAR